MGNGKFINFYDSDLGKIILTCDETGLTGLWFEGGKYVPELVTYEEKSSEIFDSAKKWLDLYFSGKNPDFIPALHQSGSPFRLAVWEILKCIPYGKTITYKDIAHKIALLKGIPKMSAQAVGGAVGHNTISIIVPCHRVVGSDGSLTGYSGGLDRKIKLLKLEKSHC